MLIILVLFCIPGAQAQEAMPVSPVEVEATPPPVDPLSLESGAPLVIELFSSQACVFCPRADRLFADLIKQPNVIGLSCHIDYFDVRHGSLSRPFCTQRQTQYMKTLDAGPNYTPQMVMQGTIDVVGYKIDEVAKNLKRAAAMDVAPLGISPGDGGLYKIAAAAEDTAGIGSGTVWLAVYDRPHDLIVSEGRNKGQKMAYYNIVSVLQQKGSWPDGAGEITLQPALGAGHAGFAVLVQDEKSGRLLAAGQYRRPGS